MFIENYRGDWTKDEDLSIFSYVLEKGPKWSKLTKICKDRTEHNIKNRFFSLISKHFHLPILKIKTSISYLDFKILQEIKTSIKISNN